MCESPLEASYPLEKEIVQDMRGKWERQCMWPLKSVESQINKEGALQI